MDTPTSTITAAGPDEYEQLSRQFLAPTPPMTRFADNLSDARILAEDAVDILRRVMDDESQADWLCALAQAKALASIALSLAFGERP